MGYRDKDDTNVGGGIGGGGEEEEEEEKKKKTVTSQHEEGVERTRTSNGAIRGGQTGRINSKKQTIMDIRGCIHKFPDWPPQARTANGTALCQ
jgi:hypothetical protein